MLNKQVIEKIANNCVARRQRDLWSDTIFEDVVELTNDERGDFGEEVFKAYKESHGFEVEYLGTKNINPEDGTYDMIIEGKRYEVKTSFFGKANSWQHENIYCSGDKYDFIAFVDVMPDRIYFTELPYEWAVKAAALRSDDIFGKKPTFRKNEFEKFKFDFSRTSIQKGIDAGVTKEVTF